MRSGADVICCHGIVHLFAWQEVETAFCLFQANENKNTLPFMLAFVIDFSQFCV